MKPLTTRLTVLHAGSSFSSDDPPYAPVSEPGTTSLIEERQPPLLAIRSAKEDIIAQIVARTNGSQAQKKELAKLIAIWVNRYMLSTTDLHALLKKADDPKIRSYGGLYGGRSRTSRSRACCTNDVCQFPIPKNAGRSHGDIMNATATISAKRNASNAPGCATGIASRRPDRAPTAINPSRGTSWTTIIGTVKPRSPTSTAWCRTRHGRRFAGRLKSAISYAQTATASGPIFAKAGQKRDKSDAERV